MPTARLDWKTVVWTLAQNSPPGLLSHRSEHRLARHSWGAFPRSLDHAGYELGVQEGSSFPLACALVGRVVSVARPSIDPHLACMGSAAVAWAGMFKMEVSAVYWTPLGACIAQFWGHRSAPFGGLVVLATTLARVVLEMVLVDALGLTSFLSFVLTLSFALGISRCLQLLEEHPFIDLPGPEKLVFLDGLHCGLQGGAICHELVDLPPGIPLGPQECKLRRRWSSSCDGWPIKPIIPFIQV